VAWEVKYDEADQAVADKRAIQDIRNWTGGHDLWEKVLITTTALVAKNTDMMQIRFALSFVGIQGYPVAALVRYVKRVGCLEEEEEG